MNDDTKSNRLGRGLAALIGDDADDYGNLDRVRSSKTVPIEFLRPNPFQPRRVFRDEDLEDLTRSIREKGILQPILVRRVEGDANLYEIVAGERRWRAAQKASLHEVPVVIKDLSDQESLEIALIENIQRADLNPIEEAAGYQRLMDQFTYTQEELSKIIGKSRSHVANMLRLLALPESVKALLSDGQLTAGHARTLVAAEDPEALAQQIIDGGLSVRAAEALSRSHTKGSPRSRSKGSAKEKDADTRALERNISDQLGLKVSVDFDDKTGAGKVTVFYATLEQLDEVCRRLAQSKDLVSPY